jgi:hypothetical protein
MQRSLKQITNVVLMIRPNRFRCNEQTAVNNYFQTESSRGLNEITVAAQTEFDNFTRILRGNGITVLIVQDNEKFDTPDSVFPNNWISFHHNAVSPTKTLDINIYPMFAVNRRHEKNLRAVIASTLESELGMSVVVANDYSIYEESDKFLEGTGSLILDRTNAIAYCARSARAHPELLEKFCSDMRYTGVAFTAYQTVQEERVPIYHTNVMMCVAETFAIICLDCIDDKAEHAQVVASLQLTGKEIITINEQQVSHFAGNMLQLQTKDLSPVLVMSSEAYSVLSVEQRDRIEVHCPIVHAPLPVIEENGGGSARCMMAEVFLS